MSPLLDRLDNAIKNYNSTVWSSQLRRSASQRVAESSRIGANEGDGYAVVVLSAGAIVGALVKLLNRLAKGWTTLNWNWNDSMGEWKSVGKLGSYLVSRTSKPNFVKRLVGLLEARSGSPKTEETTQEWACLSPCLSGSTWFQLSSWTKVQTRAALNFQVKVGTSR
ncbi:hypothetical protein CONLIGDRAFT_308588 [Coniochaeta ligniaria NRRL 30616]|uniref:Uncharacterized protein n=1 Tax=Coniochaeta ligniaria NRRL 30616 TaxID=1408157 RepID=A0A1J7JU56_9PEZI|nr:hypothetical protein CONLIGDRAFT_308588 [Coniochaeta ligniaria NRRL 30616]